MISFGRDVRVFVATQPIDFRRGVHGLVALVAEGLGGQPYSGDVFVFRSKRRDRLKLLAFDGSGIVLATKWLEVGQFDWPAPRAGTMCVTGAQLAMLVEGLSGWSKIVPRVTRHHVAAPPHKRPLPAPSSLQRCGPSPRNSSVVDARPPKP